MGTLCQEDPWAHCASSILGCGAFDNKAKSFQLEAAVVIHSFCFCLISRGLLHTSPWHCLWESDLFYLFVTFLKCFYSS